MAARRNEGPPRQPMPQPEYPVIAAFVDVAQTEDVEALFGNVVRGLQELKGQKAEQAKKVSKALERVEELMSHLIQVREKIEVGRKGKR
jgi:hypothetical protein